MNYILSWPRSGNTLFRGFFEFMTEIPTTSIPSEIVDSRVVEEPIFRTYLENKKKKNCSVYYKTHFTSEIVDTPCNNVIFIYRKPQDCIYSHLVRGGGFVNFDPVSGEQYIDEIKFNQKYIRTLVEENARWFGTNLDFIFSRIDKSLPTQIISFNDLVKDPYNVTKKAIKFINEKIVKKEEEAIEAGVTQWCRTFYEARYTPILPEQEIYLKTIKHIFSNTVEDLLGDKISKIESLMPPEPAPPIQPMKPKYPI